MSLDIHVGGHWQNITHNLISMAHEAKLGLVYGEEELSLYHVLWRADECGMKTGSDLSPHLANAICQMILEPERFEKHNSPNGWGLFENFRPWLIRLLDACRSDPNGEIEVSV